MKKKQNGFAMLEVLVSLVMLGAMVFVGWHVLSNKADSPTGNTNLTQQTQSNSTGTYKILGTENYGCTKSIPAQCSGFIKVQFPSETQKPIKIDNDTNFNGADPADLYKSNKNPLKADLELDGDLVKSIKLL